MPVLAARRAGTSLHPRIGLLLDDIIPVMDLAGRLVNPIEDILENHLLVIEKLSRFPVEFPKNTGLAGGEEQVLAARVHQNAFEYLVHVERFTGYVLEVPRQLAVFGPKRHG